MSSVVQASDPGSRAAGSNQIYAFDEFRLDAATRSLTRNGQAVGLGSRAIQLLIALIENRDRVVGKQELMELAWPRTTVVENNLPVTINALRHAFENRLYIRNEYGKGYRFVGPVRVNSDRRPAGLEADSIQAQQPSIAVLPFINAGTAKVDDVFGEGVAEDIIAALSRNRWLRVIARGSSFIYGPGGVAVGEVAQQLGVRYILEGSIRRTRDRVRVMAHLTDAITNTHLVSERWDRDLADIFAVQDEIAGRIVQAVGPVLLEAEQERSFRTHPDSVNAWLACQRGVWHMHQRDDDDLRKSMTWFQRAMELDPRYAPGYYGLSRLLCRTGSGYSTAAPADWQQQGEQLAVQAVWLDGRDSSAHAALGYARFSGGDLDGAIASAKDAVALNPSDSYAYANLGASLVFAGRHAEGIDAVHSSIDLDPRNPLIFVRYMHIGLGLYFMRDLPAAEDHAAMMLLRWPDYFGAYRLMALVLAETDRATEAAQHLSRSFAIWPVASKSFARSRMPWYRDGEYHRLLAAMRVAGWPGDKD